MTPKEVKKHTDELYEANILYKDTSSIYPFYDLKIDKEKYPCFVQFDYFKDKLCQVYINTTNLKRDSKHTAEQIFESVKKQYIDKYTDSSSVEFPEGEIQFVRNNLLLTINNEMSSPSIIFQDHDNYRKKISEDASKIVTKSPNDDFITELKQNQSIVDATVTDVNFLYIAVVNDGQNKQAMATYYCKLAASKNIGIKAVKIVDAATFVKSKGAAEGKELAKSFCE